MVLAPTVARRRNQWLKELADGLDQLEAKVEGFKVENLQHDQEFVSAVIEASAPPSARISRRSVMPYGMRCLTLLCTVPPMRINSRRFSGTSMSLPFGICAFLRYFKTLPKCSLQRALKQTFIWEAVPR
jgi:hypothetical protein